MSKAILIMDMPRACVVCPFCYKADLMAQGNYLYKQLYRCRMETQDVEDVYLEDILNQKPTWCPLREVPQKKVATFKDTAYDRIEKIGYNACIDEILGECEDG